MSNDLPTFGIKTSRDMLRKGHCWLQYRGWPVNDNFLIFFGFVVGVALGLVAAFANRFGMDATAVFAFGGALIGAAVTALAAILVAKHQERTRRNNAKEDRNRRQLGARAILAYDLSQVCEYARNSGNYHFNVAESDERYQQTTSWRSNRKHSRDDRGRGQGL